MWQLSIDIDPDLTTPLFAQIANGIADAVRCGRLAPGARVPGSRALAHTLEVHRNTVLAAYDELCAQGWLHAQPGRGTFVAEQLPVQRAASLGRRRRGVPARPGFTLQTPSATRGPRPVFRSRGLIPMGLGIPDVRLVPHELLARAYRRNLRRSASALLSYGDPRGHRRLRASLVDMLDRTRGLAAGPDDILITRGSQMALDLVARALVGPGDAVAVEAFGYRPAREAFARAGAQLVAVPVDERGLCIDELEAVLGRMPLRAIYVTPHHQYPTTAVLAPERRHRLLALARRHRFAIVEDDYDNEIHYQGRPVLPLASADEHGLVVYVGSLSKILAPGLRIGYLVAPRALIDHLSEVRSTVDGGGDPALECAVAELLEDDEVQKHARRMRRIYRSRRDLMLELLDGLLAGVIRPRVPSGGMALWAQVTGVDPEAWAERAAACGVMVSPGRWFAADDRPAPFLRLGFAACDEGELRAGVGALVRAL